MEIIVNKQRRDFIKQTGLLTLGTALPAMAAEGPKPEARDIKLYNLHTGEKVKVCYFEEGRYVEESLHAINHLLRDFRTGEVVAIDRKLLDGLYFLSKRLKRDETFEIISGYRSPATNSHLRQTTGGVAKKSFHMLGQAVDIRMGGVSTADLKKAAASLRIGGVGYYPKSAFVHFDIGPIRYWRG